MRFPASSFWFLVQGWKASWLCWSAQQPGAGPLHHPPHVFVKGSNIWSWSVPLSVLASRSLMGCSSTRLSSQLSPLISVSPILWPLGLSLSPSFLPSCSFCMYVPLGIYLCLLFCLFFFFLTSCHLRSMSQSIFSHLYFFGPLRHELLIWFHLEPSQEQCPEWSEDLSTHPNPVLSSLLFPSSLIYSRKDTPTHTLSPSPSPPLQHPFLDLRLLTLSSEGEQLWRRIVWGINSRQRTARPPAPSSQGDGGGRAVMERLPRSCLWNTVGITHSSSNSAGRGWAVPFVWEGRGGLTRLLSAARDQLEGGDVIGAQALLPQLKWRGWGKYVLQGEVQTNTTANIWNWSQVLRKCFCHSSRSWGERFLKSRASRGKRYLEGLNSLHSRMPPSLPSISQGGFFFFFFNQFTKHIHLFPSCIWNSYYGSDATEHGGHGIGARQAWFPLSWRLHVHQEIDGTFQVVLVAKNPPADTGDTRDASSVPGSGRSPSGEDGNLPQCSCLENSTDRGAWWATVHRVAKSWLLLSTHGFWVLGDR